MRSVRSILLGTLAASLALAGSGRAGEPATDQVDIGALWGAMAYCSDKGTEKPEQKAEYQKIAHELRMKLRQVPRSRKQQAFISKKTVHRAGVYEGQKLDPETCSKLRSTAELAAQETEAGSATEKTGAAKKSGGAP